MDTELQTIQNGWGSCTANATSHGVQVLAVKDKGIEPNKGEYRNQTGKDLWEKHCMT